VGSTHGFAGLKEMSRRRFVSYDPRPAEAPVFAFPYDAEASSIADAALQAIHGRSFASRFLGAAGLLRRSRFRARRGIASFLLSALAYRR
jgi:hypothetical protein